MNSLKELALIDFNEKTVLVTIHSPEEIKKHIVYLKTKFGFSATEYFYSGFLYIDVDKWLKNKVTEKTLELLANTKDLVYFDQDALNIIINDDKVIVDKKFNYCYWPTSRHKPPDNTVIIHYIGSSKPWMAWYRNKRTRKMYLDYKNKSFWKDEPLTQPITKRQIRLMAKRFAVEKEYLQSLQWLFKYFTNCGFKNLK